MAKYLVLLTQMLILLESKNETPGITKSATTADLTAFENNITTVSDLVKKADYDAKIIDIKINISPHLIIMVSQTTHLMQR